MQNNKLLSIIMGLVLVAGVAFLVYSSKNGRESPLQNDSLQDLVSEGITLLEISEHTSRESCWSAINGNVYDLTSWIPNHPGGEKAILSLCGTDGSSAFNGQHAKNKKPPLVLSGFKIGALAQ